MSRCYQLGDSPCLCSLSGAFQCHLWRTHHSSVWITENRVHYLRLSTLHSWLICVSRTTRYPTEIPIWAYKLRKLSSRNGTMSQIGVLKWKLIPGARTHSLRVKVDRTGEAGSIQSTFQLGVDSTQAGQSQQSGNHKQEGWNSPLYLQQLKSGRQRLKSKWFPEHICTSEKALPEAVKNRREGFSGKDWKLPSLAPKLPNSTCEIPIVDKPCAESCSTEEGDSGLWPCLERVLARQDEGSNSGLGLYRCPGLLLHWICHQYHECYRSHQKNNLWATNLHRVE